MKLGKDVLVEIVAIFQEGLLKGEDVSQRLRDLELVEGEDGEVNLSQFYLKQRGRL